MSCSPSSGSVFAIGSHAVTCTVTDNSGLTANCTFSVTVIDNQHPVIASPANITKTSDLEPSQDEFREIVNVIFYQNRTGCQWAYLQHDLPPKSATYYYFALCREDCKGLCVVCGANLNRETCDCKRDWEDPRLAALKMLKK